MSSDGAPEAGVSSDGAPEAGVSSDGAPEAGDGATLADAFCAALEAVGGSPERCASHAEALERAAALVGDRPAIIDEHPDLGDLHERLRVVTDPWEAEVGVTGALVAAADSGTLVLDIGAGRPRRTSLVPPVHVALVPHARLVATYADGISRVAALDPLPSSVHFVTGPSRSADIEVQLVRGVHGPGAVHVLLYPKETDAAPAGLTSGACHSWGSSS